MPYDDKVKCPKCKYGPILRSYGGMNYKDTYTCPKCEFVTKEYSELLADKE